MKRFIFALFAMIAFGGMSAKADTSLLTTADGWTKITSVPTAQEIGANYYVFVDATRDLMLGIGKGEQNTTKWYSLALYYCTSVSPTSKDITPMVWTLESNDGGFSMRNLDQPVHLFQTENNAAWYFDTNDVTSSNEWSKVNLAYADGKWTLENGKYTGNYIGPWNDNNFTNGAECAANKTTALRGYFHIYAISRAQFKQNLLDNASASNPVDLTPWYVTNPTLDQNADGWTSSFTANSASWWGSHAFSNTGAENYQQVADFQQTLTLPNGKYKVAMQGATNKTEDNEPYVYGTHDGTKTKTYFTQSTKTTTDGNKWNDMQYTLLQMMSDRSWGQVMTSEITVTTGSLTIGYANEGGWSWDVFDNFKLYCTGVDLSAYQTQLSNLVSECNTFISSAVVPDACETIISNAISQYNKTYETGKEYSTAIVALTGILNTYRNNAELQAAYAAYYALKAKVEALATGQSSSTSLTTLNTAVSNATTAIENATTTATIEEQTANLRSAVLTYISSVEGQFDITFLASQDYRDWNRKDGSAAGIVQDQFLANRPNTIPPFAENFEWTATTTGNVLYQTVSGLPAGYYQVGMYTMALSTSQRDTNISTEATEGDSDRSFAFAGDLNDATSIQRTGMPIKFATAVDFDDLTTLDVNVHLSSAGALTFGVQKDTNGSNWHFAQIVSIVYSNSPDLTQLKATRDALVAEAMGLKNGADAVYLTNGQKETLQNAINAGVAADDFDELNTVTLTTLPNAINTAKQQIAQAKAAVPAMIAALERFENDYNLTDGTDYRRVNMSAKAWTNLLDAVNDVTTALDDISQASNYANLAAALVSQMDATDASLRLFKSYKAMVEGTTALGIVGNYGADSNMDTDVTEETAITALGTAFDTYAMTQTGDFNTDAFLGANLDFSAAQGAMIAGKGNGVDDGNYGIFEITGWEEIYKDYAENYYIQTANTKAPGKLYIRSNWESGHPTLQVMKQKMLPVGHYKLSFYWKSDMANMNNLSYYKIGSNNPVALGENGDKTIEVEFDIENQPQAFDLSFGFKRTSDGNNPAEIQVDNVVLTYLQTSLILADNGTDAANNGTKIANVVNGRSYDVTLQGRTLYKDGSWNTLCLPFSMTADQVTAQLDPAALVELDTQGKWAMVNGEWQTSNDGHVTGVDGSTLYLNFKEATAITSGTPYLIKWSGGDDLVSPTFRAVTVSGSSTAGSVSSTDQKVTIQGTYVPVPLANGDKTNLFLGADNTLRWPNVDNYSVNAFRAYFHLSEGVSASRIVLNFGDENTGISDIVNGQDGNRIWFDLQGRHVSSSSSPLKKGLYINNGKKVIIK